MLADNRAALPATVVAAVRLLKGLVPEAEQGKIAYMEVVELTALDFGLGQ